MNKPEQGHADKANTAPKRFLYAKSEMVVANYEVGQEVQVDIFADRGTSLADVTGVSSCKGFQQAIAVMDKAADQWLTCSRYHRRPGVNGTVAPNRVFKGKALPGQMGGVTVTTQNLEIVSVDVENGLILVKGWS